MSNENVFIPMQSLQKAPVIEPGGLCSFVIFKKEDVLSWPSKNPLSGYLATTVQLKAGKSFFLVAATDKDRTFTEELKRGPEGPYYEILLTGVLPGNTASNTLSIEQMQFSDWGSIVHDRDGMSRLIGNEDSCAEFNNKYSPADISGSRKRNISFSWQNSLPLPIYSAQGFTISIGGVPVTAGKLTLIMRFQVGRPGAPMNDGDTSLVNAAFANKTLLVLANGIGVPCDDSSGDIDWTAPPAAIARHYEKTFAANSMNWVGGVVQDEIIEIYAFSL
jgi:hypothetical protein